MIYIALLRGINVGGNNPVSMKVLKTTFEQAGMNHVKTYINSGNIVFSNQEVSALELPLKLEEAIAAEFGLQIRVIVRTIEEIRAVIEALPDSWTNDDQMKSDVMFLWKEIDEISILELLPLKPGVGTVLYIPGAVLYSVSREEVTRSGMNKLIGTKLYMQMTIRNVNTTRQIYKLMQAVEE